MVALSGLVVLLAAIPQAQNYPAARSGGNYMHNYYLPPAGSSTPWWPTWSPDGQWIAFAMHGSLWRMRIADGVSDGVAEEIAHANEFLSSPEWSPDGRYIAYTADPGGASINIRLLNLTTGESTAITTGEHVNVEPAWSPDGRRLAYVSTAPNGYFNIFVTGVEAGKPGPTTRITNDNRFGRDRLYFGDVDVHLSPSWSPDGSELLFVSNRGIALGSGGIWRAHGRGRRHGERPGNACFTRKRRSIARVRRGRRTESDSSTPRISAASSPICSFSRRPAASRTR